jgi:hypothetical protein
MMHSFFHRCGKILPILLCFTLAATTSQAAEIDFKQDIAPLLNKKCGQCHGAEKQKGGLRFDHKAGAFAKGDSGQEAIVAGKAQESELLRRITSADDATRMPPQGERLSKPEVDLLTQWINRGAAWPEETQPLGKSEMVITPADREHWSFRPLQTPAVPSNEGTSNQEYGEIDRFLLATLQTKSLTFAPPASARQLIRRMYFDVIGLPPEPHAVAAFEQAAEEDRSAAIAELVDRLLASPHYGERWGRHWLDLARYADSHGQEGDQDRPFAYQYRDLVIRALNEDLPYDTFVRWQIAGDELEPDVPAAVAATGFLVAGPHTVLDVPMEEEKIRNRYNELDDTLATLGSAMLGLTVGCARCHDHKYDPIPTRDYYRLLAAVHSGERREAFLGTQAEIQKYEQAYEEWRQQFTVAEKAWKDWVAAQRVRIGPKIRLQRIAALPISPAEKELLSAKVQTDEAKRLAKVHEKAFAISEGDLKNALSESELRDWDQRQAALQTLKNAEPKSLPQAYTFRDTTAEAKPTWLFHRADFYDKTEPVQLGFLSVLTTTKSPADYWQAAQQKRIIANSTYQRAAVAQWLTDVDHGAGALLARVMVNRVWQHHFGEGLVRTPNDFGVQGERPTHPELLEWLAADFVSHGWKLKRLHRQIMLSNAYLQSIHGAAASLKLDPDGRWLSRRRPQRLEAEILRDAMLATAGTLNRAAFGPGFKPPVAPEAMTARNLKTPYNPEAAESPNLLRRTVYMFHKRVVPNPLLQAFDRPDAQQSCGRRDTTTVAPQALALLNDAFVRDRARELAKRVLSEGTTTTQISQLFACALSRPATETEITFATQFLTQRTAARLERDPQLSAATANQQAWTDLCQAVFSLNEFLYVD